jgi:hypothetical protein
MNDDNLIPLNQRTTSERREISRMGGIASGRGRRERKKLKDELTCLLETGATQKAICIGLIDKAMRGDTRAFEIIRDTLGENPKLRLEREEESND